MSLFRRITELHPVLGARFSTVLTLALAFALGPVAAAFAATSAAPSAEVPVLSFGVLNQQSPVRTAQRWNPILAYVNSVTGLNLQMKMGATVAETNARMAKGEFDLVFSNHNFRPEYDGVYKVIASWSSEPIHGVIAVPADSPAKSLKDLNGKRIAFPNEWGFTGYAVPLSELKRRNVRFEPVFSGNQEGALAQLKAGQVQAAGLNSRFLRQFAQANQFAYRELYVSETYPDLAVSVHPRLPEAQVKAIRSALLGMRADPAGEAALKAAESNGFSPAAERDYAGVRRVYRAVER